MRRTPTPVVAAMSAALALAPTLARADDGSANCALITQAAAGGVAARIQADDRDIAAPRSVTTLSCLDGFFNGVGLNVVTNLLNPGNLLAAVEGKICAAVQQTWTNLIGSVQCGLTITGFDPSVPLPEQPFESDNIVIVSDGFLAIYSFLSSFSLPFASSQNFFCLLGCQDLIALCLSDLCSFSVAELAWTWLSAITGSC